MNARITLGLAVATATLLGLGACGSGSDSDSSGAGSPTESTKGDTPTIGYIQTGPFDYYLRGVDGAQAAADALGVDLEVFNSDNKPEKELANVEDAIARGVDGLVIFSVGKSSLEADLAKANAAGIPAVVLYGYDPSIESKGLAFIQASTEVTGTQAGQWTAENVTSGEVAVIQGLLGRGDAESYTEGFMTGLAENPDLDVVATVPADWDRAKAQAAMADILTAHPRLSAVFVMNDDMALGAIAAIQAAGKAGQVTVVSQNGSPDGLEAVESGDLAATVAWSPAQESQMAMSRIVAYLRDSTAPSPALCNTPTTVVTQDNLSEAPPWVPTPESTKVGLNTACAS